MTELPITPERVLRALEAEREPRREGKAVIFDEQLSVNTVSAEEIPFRFPVGLSAELAVPDAGTECSSTSSFPASTSTRSAASRC